MQFMSTDMNPGFHFVVAYLAEAALDDYRLWLPEAEDTTLAGQPALAAGDQYVVELPGGTRVLQLSITLDESDEGLAVEPADLAELLTAHILGRSEG